MLATGINRPVMRPHDIGLPNDGGGWTHYVGWSSWGPQEAIGNGWAFFHTCNPSCAQGFAYWEPVTITLDMPRQTPFGVLLTRMVMTWCVIQDCGFGMPSLSGIDTAPSGPPSKLNSWALVVMPTNPRGVN